MIKICNLIMTIITFFILNNFMFGYSGGMGNNEDPYEISIPDDLSQLIKDTANWDKNYLLVNDIDLKGTNNFSPIGINKKSFSGIFNGNGFKILNFNIDLKDISNIGLFGYNSGVIKNLQIDNCKITGLNNIGVICAYNSGLIQNCKVNSNIEGNDYIGGICGTNIGTISNCISASSIDGGSFIGIVCGFNNKGTICFSESEGTISGKIRVGGFCGSSLNAIIYYSKSTINVEGDSIVGGFCGDIVNGIIMTSSSKGIVQGRDYTGGFSGYLNKVENVSNCFSRTKSICLKEANGIVGGFCGYNILSYIEFCYSDGNVTGKGRDANGFCGSDYSGKYNSSYWDLEASGLKHYSAADERTTSEMMTQSNYKNWLFGSVWTIKEGEYPELLDKHKYSGGTGSNEDPRQLSNLADLEYLMYWFYDWNDSYILINNIDCQEIANPHPIGNDNYIFNGSFKGNGKVISNLSMNLPEVDKVGLFGIMTGIITDLGLDNINIIGRNKVGGLCGSTSNDIYNCYVRGNVKGKSEVGGLCGIASGYYVNCFTKITVVGSGNNIGGMFGISGTMLTINSHTSGTVTGISEVGGFVGSCDGNIRNCFSECNVQGDSYVGGFFGVSDQRDSISYCYSTGNVIGNTIIGGFAGSVRSNIENCYSKGNVIGRNASIGGFCGYFSNIFQSLQLRIYKCWSSGNVFGNNNTGGFCGTNELIIKDSYVKCDTVSGKNNVGGFCGINYLGALTYCTSNTYVYSDSLNSGGFCGLNDGAIFLCSARGILQSVDSVAGGFCGHNSNVIMNCFSHTKITGLDLVGGFCGMNNKALIASCYSTGVVISSGVSTGGFCGYSLDSDIKDCYWDYQSSGIHISSGGIPKSSFEVKRLTEYSGWNFNVIWNSVTEQYPEFAKPYFYSGGNGTAVEPYLLKDFNDLEYLMFSPDDWNKHFFISGNIDCRNIQNPNPIGFSTNVKFTGYFHGNGFEISNYNLIQTYRDYVGLFGFNIGLIENVRLINSKISGNNYIGGICGHNGYTYNNYDYNSISNCYIAGEIQGNNYIGGVCGFNFKRIDCCISESIVKGNDIVGGLSGYNMGSIIFSSSNIKVEGINYVAGFCAINYDAYISKCSSKGIVVCDSGFVSGFCKSNIVRNDIDPDDAFPIYERSTIKDCYSQVDVYTKNGLGSGFIGSNTSYGSYCDALIENCYSTGKVESNNNEKSGFCYRNYNNIIRNCYWDIETSGIKNDSFAVGRKTLEMYKQENYLKWDFNNVWYISPNDYPRLYPYKPVSVEEVNLSKTTYFLILPNPASDYIQIQPSEDFSPSEGSVVEIFDMLGFNIITEPIHPLTSSHRMNIERLPAGVYFVKIGERVEKFVKM